MQGKSTPKRTFSKTHSTAALREFSREAEPGLRFARLGFPLKWIYAPPTARPWTSKVVDGRVREILLPFEGTSIGSYPGRNHVNLNTRLPVPGNFSPGTGRINKI